ncbi:MAG TPA: hypothetical protein VFQ39_09315 [Longimicrobium sp.]|nr:hypothetical protein [Longimicrobium sp.]
MLSEIPGDLGEVFWRSVRNVLLSADAPEEARSRLFHPVNDGVRDRYAGAILSAPDLASTLRVLASVQEGGAVSEALVARACHHVYAWADARAFPATATLFAEAAAYVSRDDPTLAIDAGWSCRRSGGMEMLDRSGVWYQRAFRLAVRARDRKEVIRALNGYGALMQDLGRYEEAHASYTQAARRARRNRRYRQLAVSHHYLLGLAVEVGSVEDAAEHARRALDMYPRHDERLPYLAHDLAFLLIQKCYYRPALRLLERAAQRMERPYELGLLFGTTARAAAGSGRIERFLRAERAALELVQRREDFAAGSLVHLAEGARLLGDWNRAERYAVSALTIARRRHEYDLEKVAAELVDVIARRLPAAPVKSLPPDHPFAMLSERLAARLRPKRRRERTG